MITYTTALCLKAQVKFSILDLACVIYKHAGSRTNLLSDHNVLECARVVWSGFVSSNLGVTRN